MSLRVVMVVDRFPNEPFLAKQVAALLARSVDVDVLCQIADDDSDAWSHLDRAAMRGRVHPWPDRGRPAALVAAATGTAVGGLRRRRLALARPLAKAILAERRRTVGDRHPLDRHLLDRHLLGRILFDLRVVALDPDVVHFQFGDLARARTHVADAVDAGFSSSFRGYDLAYAGLDDAGFYDHLWPALDGAHTLGCDLVAVAGRRGAPPDLAWTIIPPAVDVDRFTPPDRAGRGAAADDELRLLSVGRLHWKKGLVDGLVAVAHLRDEGRRIRYRLVGDGPAEEQLRWTIADLGLERSVELLGRGDADEVDRQLAWADAFLHPSHSEGFANAVLEAQAMALPVVCTDAEGLRENVVDGETGIVVPRRQPVALADALRRLDDEPDLRLTLGLAGRRRVVERFDLDAQTDAFVDYFERVAERGGRR
ncbi:MAG: glycosyltransferase family 4 protein [Actinomycetota bacterium]